MTQYLVPRLPTRDSRGYGMETGCTRPHSTVKSLDWRRKSNSVEDLVLPPMPSRCDRAPGGGGHPGRPSPMSPPLTGQDTGGGQGARTTWGPWASCNPTSDPRKRGPRRRGWSLLTLQSQGLVWESKPSRDPECLESFRPQNHVKSSPSPKPDFGRFPSPRSRPGSSGPGSLVRRSESPIHPPSDAAPVLGSYLV